MKSWSNTRWLGATVVVLSHLVFTNLAATEMEMPLTVSPAEYVGEDWMSGSSHDLVFVLNNTTSEAVQLRYIFAECDCSLILPDQGLVPAEGEFALVAQLNLKDFDEGLLDEVITILTDHPIQREITIPVSGLVTEKPNDDHGGKRWRKGK